MSVVPRFLEFTAGCGGGNFCPGNVVLRDQMAVFVTQTFQLPTP